MAAWSNVMGAWGEVERLCFRPTPQPLDERLGGGRIADLGAGDDIDEGVAALAPGLRQLGPAVQLLRAEIGRASCRERVCQSVWISVVAVSLKKTKYKITKSQ